MQQKETKQVNVCILYIPDRFSFNVPNIRIGKWEGVIKFSSPGSIIRKMK